MWAISFGRLRYFRKFNGKLRQRVTRTYVYNVFMNVCQGLHNSSSCTPCTAGSYCKYPGWTNETGLCEKGSFCPQSSRSSQEMLCPAGRYCPSGSDTPSLCPRGTFSNNTGLWAEWQCTNCTSGYYCDSEGRTTPSGECEQGYYCPTSSKTAKAVDCPNGLHCPTGIKFFFVVTRYSSCSFLYDQF